MIRAALTGRNGSVVVLHCGPSATPRILLQIIEGYQARGFQFVTVPTLLGMSDPARMGVQRRPWAWAGRVVGTSGCPTGPSVRDERDLDGPRHLKPSRWRTSHQRGVGRLRATRTLRGGCALRPAQDAQGPQRVPAAGLTVAGVHLEVDRALVRVLQEPGAVGLLLRADSSIASPTRSSGRSPVERKYSRPRSTS